MNEDKKTEETTPPRAGSKGALFAVLLAVLVLMLTMFMATNFFGLRIGGNPEISPYYQFRVISSLIIIMGFIPGSIWAEWLSSQEKRRRFRPKNIILFSAFFMEVLAIMLSLSFVLELFLPNGNPLLLVTLFAVIGSIAMVSLGLTFRAINRNPRTRRLIERAIT